MKTLYTVSPFAPTFAQHFLSQTLITLSKSFNIFECCKHVESCQHSKTKTVRMLTDLLKRSEYFLKQYGNRKVILKQMLIAFIRAF